MVFGCVGLCCWPFWPCSRDRTGTEPQVVQWKGRKPPVKPKRNAEYPLHESQRLALFCWYRDFGHFRDWTACKPWMTRFGFSFIPGGSVRWRSFRFFQHLRGPCEIRWRGRPRRFFWAWRVYGWSSAIHDACVSWLTIDWKLLSPSKASGTISLNGTITPDSVSNLPWNREFEIISLAF